MTVGARRLLSLLVLAAACNTHAPSAPRIALRAPPDDPSGAFVEVTGLAAADLDALRRAGYDRDGWERILRVSVKQDPGGEAEAQPAVAGAYAVEGSAVRFTPLFPFDAGREYDVALDLSSIAGGAAWARASAVVSRPAEAAHPSTTVTHVYPSGRFVPENQLRLYIHFSAPMGLRAGLEHIALIDEDGRELKDAFLPLDTELWNHDRTRYTVLFDPGRVKRGILPNRHMGRALRAGRSYTLVVRRDWLDGGGQPLAAEFSTPIAATRAIERPIDLGAWQIDAPAQGTRTPLVVRMPHPLDRGLLERALGVRRNGAAVPGDVRIDENETRWTFTPAAAWAPGDYTLFVLSILEDVAGNRIGRAFEVKASAAAQGPESFEVPFKLGQPGHPGSDLDS